jgi:hypothetical protein
MFSMIQSKILQRLLIAKKISRNPKFWMILATDFCESSSNWWKDRRKRREILYELPAILYYWLAYGLLGIESDPIWMPQIKKQYLGLIKSAF